MQELWNILKKITFSEEESYNLAEEIIVAQFRYVFNGKDIEEDYFRKNIREIINYFDKYGNIYDTIKYHKGIRYISAYKR